MKKNYKINAVFLSVRTSFKNIKKCSIYNFVQKICWLYTNLHIFILVFVYHTSVHQFSLYVCEGFFPAKMSDNIFH